MKDDEGLKPGHNQIRGPTEHERLDFSALSLFLIFFPLSLSDGIAQYTLQISAFLFRVGVLVFSINDELEREQVHIEPVAHDANRTCVCIPYRKDREREIHWLYSACRRKRENKKRVFCVFVCLFLYKSIHQYSIYTQSTYGVLIEIHFAALSSISSFPNVHVLYLLYLLHCLLPCSVYTAAVLYTYKYVLYIMA